MTEEQRVLLPEQAEAAYQIDKHISVTAVPGSGKTTVLVERYLHILREQSLSIDQIVAITFTNRAANEMRERLRKELNLIVDTATGDERRRWLNYKRTLDGAVITTIHGFCARLLREFPIEARVDPQFLLLDEHRAAMMLELIVEEVLSEFISNGHIEISRLTLASDVAGWHQRLPNSIARHAARDLASKISRWQRHAYTPPKKITSPRSKSSNARWVSFSAFVARRKRR